jgi:hypothetical protein
VYRFNDSIDDSSGNGRHLGNVIGGPPSYPAGKFGQALGATGQPAVRAGRLNDLLGVGFPGASLSFWVYPVDVDGDLKAPGVQYTSVQYTSALSVTVNVKPDVALLGTALAAAVTPGAWHHVAVTLDGTDTYRLYVDGSLAGSESSPSALSGLADIEGLVADSFRVQTAADEEGQVTAGAIDDLAVVPAVLTAGEVAYLWNGGAGNEYPV